MKSIDSGMIDKHKLINSSRCIPSDNVHADWPSRFKTSVNIAKTRSFPGADIGSDHELVMMTFKLHLKRAEKNNATQGSDLTSKS